MDSEAPNPRAAPVRLLDPRVVAGVGFSAVVVLGVLGIATVVNAQFMNGLFRLDRERTVPAVFSAFLLVAAASASIWIGRSSTVGRYGWYGLALVLGGMGLDEALSIHERLEAALGIDWQLLYIPVVALAAVCWTLAVTRVRPFERFVLFAGAGAWSVSQVFELVQWDGDVKVQHYHAMMVPEELLEMSGSLLFLLALVIARRSSSRAEQGSGSM